MAAHPHPLDREQVAAREWPVLRSRLVEIAATLDRLEAVGDQETRGQAEELLRELLASSDEPRVERLLRSLSRPYDPAWRERFAAGDKSID